MDISLVIANDWLIVFNANVNVDVWNLQIKDHLKDFAQLSFVIDAIETSLKIILNGSDFCYRPVSTSELVYVNIRI
jgi:hypothetical protein